jgi:glutamate racemase
VISRPGTDAPIGVFDSGIGGLSILRALRAQLPHEHYVYFADTGHAPYGERGDAYVRARSLAIAQQLVEQHRVKALVVACNTATAAAIDLLREQHPDLPIVGVEPALKPAVALSRTGRIAVLATRTTLQSGRFQALHAGLAPQAQFILQACDGLAEAIEQDETIKIIAASAAFIRASGLFGIKTGEIDTLVLGCTHYPLVRSFWATHVGPQVNIIETGEPVARQTHRLLAAADVLTSSLAPGSLSLLSTGPAGHLEAAAARWL